MAGLPVFGCMGYGGVAVAMILPSRGKEEVCNDGLCNMCKRNL